MNRYIIDTTTGNVIVQNITTVKILKQLIPGPQGEQGEPGFGALWGDIGGNLSNQTDLQIQLDKKSDINHDHDANYSDINHNHDGSYAGIVHNHTESEITDLDKYNQAEVDSKDSLIQGSIDAHKADISNPHVVTFAQLPDAPTSLPPEAHTHTENDVINLDKYSKAEVDAKDSAVQNSVDLHKADTNNPHNVDINDVDGYTKAQIDSSQSAQDIQINTNKTDINDNSLNINTHKARTDNPHNVVYEDLGGTQPPALPHTHLLADVTDSGSMASQDDADYDDIVRGRVNGTWEDILITAGVVSYNVITEYSSQKVWDDINNTDWTGHIHSDGSALAINKNNVVFICNGTVTSFVWVGPSPVKVGVGGNYIAGQEDILVIGVGDHDLLENGGTYSHQEIDDHVSSLVNPHAVTAEQVGASLETHSHIEVDITDLDKYTQAEIDDLLSLKSHITHNHDSVYSIIGHNHDSVYSLIGHDHSGVYAPVSHIHAEADVTDLDRVRWKNKWISVAYIKNDMVIDGDWLMIANKGTSDRAAPQPIGFPENSLDQSLIFATASDISVVKMVHKYTTLKPGWLQKLYVKVPSFDVDSIARITIYNPNTDETTVHSNLILSPNEWLLITSVNNPVAVGHEIDVIFEFYNSSAANSVDGSWNSNIGAGTPITTEFEIDNATVPTRIAIDHTDLDAVDRTTELQGVAVDSIINISETGDLARNVEVKVTAVDTADPNFTVYTVSLISLGNSIRDNRSCTIEIDIPITQPSEYSVLTGYYPGNDPTFANVVTELYFDGVQQASSTDAYGIYIVFQEGYVSPDWDLLALSGGSGGSSSSSIEVQDESISLTTSLTKINFTGAGVTAISTVSGEVEVDIPGGGASGTPGYTRKTGSFTVDEADGFDHYYWLDTSYADVITLPDAMSQGHRFTVQMDASHSFSLAAGLAVTVPAGKTLAPAGDGSVISFIAIYPSGDLHATGDLA